MSLPLRRAPNSGVVSLKRKAILLRVVMSVSSPTPVPIWEYSRCGNHLEILWDVAVDRVRAALYGCKVSRTVGFVPVGSAQLSGLTINRIRLD